MNEKKFWYIVIGIILGILLVGLVVSSLIGIPFMQNQQMIESYPVPQPL